MLSYVLSSVLFSGLINCVNTNPTVVLSPGVNALFKFDVLMILLYFVAPALASLLNSNALLSVICHPVPLLLSVLKFKLFAT